MPRNQQSEAAAYAQRPDLTRKIVKQSARRISTVRKIITIDRLPTEELPGLAQSALSFGFYRALLNRFIVERGIREEWWKAQRREHAKTSKDRTNDLAIIKMHYPEFSDYYPEIPLTEDEVIEAALLEFRDMIAGPGTEYHELESQRAKVRSGVSLWESDGSTRPVATGARRDGGVGVSGDVHGGSQHARYLSDFLQSDLTDMHAQERVENVVEYALIENEDDLLGPAVTRAVEIALRDYGQSGLYWLAELLMFPKKYTEMLRALGGDEQALGLKEFERIKRDMVRKLPDINERMLDLLRRDPEMDALREILHRDVIVPNAKVPDSPHTLAAREVYSSERAGYVDRQTAKMYDAVGRDDDVRDLLPWLQETERAEILREFIEATDGFKWEVFKKHLRKRYDESCKSKKVA